MSFKTLLTLKAIVCLISGPILLFIPATLFKILGGTLEFAGTFTAREYGATLIGGFFLYILARNTEARDARRALLVYLFVYDLIGFIITLIAISSGILNILGLSVAFVYLFFTLGSALLIIKKPILKFKKI